MNFYNLESSDSVPRLVPQLKEYDVDEVTAIVPNVGDTVHIEDEDKWRKVSKRKFMYLTNTRAIQVLIFLKKS